MTKYEPHSPLQQGDRELQEGAREMQRGYAKAVPQDVINDIVADSRRTNPNAMAPLPNKAASGSGWAEQKPFTNEPSYAERRLADVLPAQGRRGF